MKSDTFFDSLQSSVPNQTLAGIADFIFQVEEELADQLKSKIASVEKVGELTWSSGGKRLRPALVYLSAAATQLPFDQKRAVRIGAAMELIHMATLIHDDVIDDSSTRRGKPTAFSIYGNTASILSGDVLLAKAMYLLADDGDLEIIRMTSRAVVELAEGEVKELELRGKFELLKQDHYEVLRMKTASFIECCCRAGAILANSNVEQQNGLGKYGHHIGMAFQIADDILDYRGDAQKTGKPIATDFREGQATLPLIHLIEELTEEEKDFTDYKFGNGVSEDELKMIIGWMEHRGSFKKSDDDAHHEIQLAIQHLQVFPDSPEMSLLSSVADYIVARQT